MTDQYTITPPPELLQQWATEYWGNPGESIGYGEKYIAIQAARWGADQELEACREEIIDGAGRLYIDDPKLRICLADNIWTARRPKPKSLAEEALEALKHAEEGWRPVPADCDIIRRALERLQQLENNQ